MQKYVISIDVGGTFTDCVIVEESGRVAHSAVEAAAVEARRRLRLNEERANGG